MAEKGGAVTRRDGSSCELSQNRACVVRKYFCAPVGVKV